MKVDGLAIILIVIILPIILLVTYLIQMQVDTVATECSYNTKLLDAAYDSMAAFELNTANEELSTVADSMRSIISATNNVFLNSLATSLGMSNASKELLQPYIPSVLYTMYDGYYIYSPSEVPVIAEKQKAGNATGELIATEGYYSIGDQGTITDAQIEGFSNATYGDIIYKTNFGGYEYTTNIENAEKKIDYILKPYTQYSGRYVVDGRIDVTINYTLDNYLNIVGNVGDGIYYTKSGYLINPNIVKQLTINGEDVDITVVSSENEDLLEDKILGVKTNVAETTKDAASAAKVVVNGGSSDVTIETDWSVITAGFAALYGDITLLDLRTIEDAESLLNSYYEFSSNENHTNAELAAIQNIEYEIQKYKAISYYASSTTFSRWVYDKLGTLTYGDIKDSAASNFYQTSGYEMTSGLDINISDDIYYNFHDLSIKDEIIFDSSVDPEAKDSNFYRHKIEVIKNSIKYNLNIALTSYRKLNSEHEFALPILSASEWDKILNNISIVAFMQGWDCGLDIYNNYAIASSTNNELMISPEEIYFIEKEQFNAGHNLGNGYYHRIDCPKFEELDVDKKYISFRSKEVKYDKTTNKKATTGYLYDHKNLSCYTCINNSNYQSMFSVTSQSYYERINSLKKSALNPVLSEFKKLGGYIGIAKERQQVYKTNALPISEGYKIINKNIVIKELPVLERDPVTMEPTGGITTPITAQIPIELDTVPSRYDFSQIKELQITFTDISVREKTGVHPALLNFDIQIGGAGKVYEGISVINQTTAQTIKLDVTDCDDDNIDIINLKVKDDFNQLEYVKYTLQSIKAIYK